MAMREQDKVKKEEEYYRKLFGDDIKLSYRSEDKWKSYKLVNESSLVIGISSTLLFEAFAMGKPVLLCYTGCAPWYGKLMEESLGMEYFKDFMLKDLDYRKFSLQVDRLLGETSTIMRGRINDVSRYACYYDVSEPPDKKICNIIHKLLSPQCEKRNNDF